MVIRGNDYSIKIGIQVKNNKYEMQDQTNR